MKSIGMQYLKPNLALIENIETRQYFGYFIKSVGGINNLAFE